MKPYSEELVQFIEENRLKYTVNELCKMIFNEFNKSVTPKALRKYFYRHNLEFKKQFYKNYNCTISKPIGTESNPDKNGLIRIKVNDKQWKYKQRYIYEQYYGVELPNDVNVIFLDGDRTNFDIKNLAVVPTKIMLTLGNHELFSEDMNVTKLGIQVAYLIDKRRGYK